MLFWSGDTNSGVYTIAENSINSWTINFDGNPDAPFVIRIQTFCNSGKVPNMVLLNGQKPQNIF
jgi:hypothetical protein